MKQLQRMSRIIKLIFAFLFSISIKGFAQKATVWLDDLEIRSFSEGIRPVTAKANYHSDSMRIGGVYYARGIGAQTVCVLSFLLDGHAREFKALVGADDEGNKDIPVKFYVVADGKLLFESGEMKVGDTPKSVDVDLTGMKRLGLLVTDDVGGSNNKRTYSDWANAQFIMDGDYLPGHIPNTGEKYILTPALGKAPRINAAKIFGVTPGNPFLFTIAATGVRPVHFSAEGLPRGLKLDSKTGIITGRIGQKGVYFSILKAKNKFGESIKKLKIIAGDTISLTPPIGWNGWNAWADDLDGVKVMASANAMVARGLADHGWSYVNIDDTWQGRRGGKYNALQPNEKFPAFKEMVDHIHSLGLKTGLYSTPYIASYGGYPGASSEFPNGGETHQSIKIDRRAFNHIGKYKFENEDARQMAEWGFDFLKYDWRIDVPSTERMSSALKRSGRDIIFSLSNNAPFDKVKDWMRLSNMYRTGPDIRDSWTSLYQLAFTLDRWGPYGGPGHWNDPDMMILGNVSTGSGLHPTRLTPDEQYSHVSIFSLLAAPLLIGCPVEQLDTFTLSLLSNDEVIEINQDPLGKPARLLPDEKNEIQVWIKPMEDGSFAVGLFNVDGYGLTPQSYFRWGNEMPKQFTFDFSKAGLKGKWRLRDVWRQKDLGVFDGSFQAEIRHHGVELIRMFRME